MAKNHGFWQLEHTADVGIGARGPTLEETLRLMVRGMFSLIVSPDTVANHGTWKIHVSAPDLDLLLFNLLEEFLFVHHTEGLLISDLKIQVESSDTTAGDDGVGEWMAQATAWGERIDPQRHKLRTEIKAVTLHGLQLKKTDTSDWEAQVIFDL